ncbi:MAG: hypothetical protein L3K01_09760 [Thermoplasmata archaeon]|nr:hypothetical protein [Thermoplasmata archaeon]
MPASPGGTSFELLSGPDLGGGFLHQLTVERFSGVNQFVYHAQNGGQDANGPPKGSPAPFGWRLSPTMCPIGGRLCWHREFTLPVEESLKVRTAYNRTRFVMEAMLGHEYGAVPVPVDAAVVELADRLNGAAEPIPWYVGGSLGLYLRGAPLTPRDGDLGTTPAAVATIAEVLRDYVTDPAAPTEWAGVPMLAARAFVGTVRNGLRVEWGYPIDPSAATADPEWSLFARAEIPDTVDWHGKPIPVAPPEYTVVRWARAGRTERMDQVAGWLREHGVDSGLMRRISDRSGLPDHVRSELLARF